MRCIVFVHAHPDDESLTTGGTMARYAAQGVRVCLVTCTNGEVGEIAEVPGLGPPDEIRPLLGEIRRAELEEACRQLGPVDLRMLGYHDSGMDGTPDNEEPHAFVQQDTGVVVDRIAQIFDEVRPQVLVTYNEYGGYGHPDHIRAHVAALAAAERCGIPKVYFTVFPKSLMRAAQEMFGEGSFSDEDIERVGTDDELVTTEIDVAPYIDHKFRALQAHRTQLGTTKLFLDMPPEIRAMGFGVEHYQLIRPVPPPAKETDLFEGLP